MRLVCREVCAGLCSLESSYFVLATANDHERLARLSRSDGRQSKLSPVTFLPRLKPADMAANNFLNFFRRDSKLNNKMNKARAIRRLAVISESGKFRKNFGGTRTLPLRKQIAFVSAAWTAGANELNSAALALAAALSACCCAALAFTSRG